MQYGSKNQIKEKSAKYYGDEEYMKWQELVREHAGVNVTIKCSPSRISVRSESYADYVLARSVLAGRTSKEVYRDIEPLGEKETQPVVNRSRTDGA